MEEDDLICPDCHHALGFHPYYYGSCEASLGGFFNHAKCGCTSNLHNLIQKLQTQNVANQLEKLQIEYQTCMDEVTESQVIANKAFARINFLESILNNVREVINEAKIVEETRPFYGWFTIDYRNEMQKIVDKALLELEKINGN
jgi:hypothetical protein